MTGSFGRIATAIAVLITAQTLFLAWMIHDRTTILFSDNIVTLTTVPVDPRDLFRGDYVTLNYNISRISLDGLPRDKSFSVGDIAYVELAPAGDSWVVAGITHDYPTLASDRKVIRGKIVSVEKNQPHVAPLSGGNDMLEKPCASCTAVVLDYGIESYFVPEGKGHELEEARNLQSLTVDVALGQDGEAAIKALRINGKLL